MACEIGGCKKPSRTSRTKPCEMHYYRMRRTGTYEKLLPVRKVVVTYHVAHHRIRKLRGSARRQRCIDCGRRAEQWSYDHSDPNELRYRGGPAYSLDPDKYEPRCKSCHSIFDAVGNHLPVLRGEKGTAVKLTERQVRQIRTMYAKGGTIQTELARKYGVSQSEISNIVRAKTWAHSA